VIAVTFAKIDNLVVTHANTIAITPRTLRNDKAMPYFSETVV